jgi:hypothetical protein
MEKISWKQDFINNMIWYVIFNIASVWIGKPMYANGEMSGLRTLAYFIVGFVFLGSWISVTKLLAQKKGWFVAILISLPVSLILNFFIINIIG